MLTSKLRQTVKLYLFRNYINYKFVAILLFYIIYVNTIVEPFRLISKEIGYSINYGLFALLLTDVRAKLVFFVGVAILYSNLPFKDALQMPIITRLGKRIWYFSQIIYIFISSIAINVAFFLSFILTLLPYISFDNGWGTLLRSLGRQDLLVLDYIEGPMLPVSNLVINNYNPDQAIFLTLSISILVTVIIGLIIMLGNRLIQNGGIIVTYLLIFINLFVPRALGRYIYFFSPLTWISLTYSATSEQSYLPSHSYIYIVSGLLIVILTLAILLMTHRRTEIEIGR